MTDASDDVRATARKRLEERRGFVPHLIMFLVLNAGLVVIWAATGTDNFFWPVFSLLLWGSGLVMHAWSAFLAKPITDAEVDREARRLDHPADRHEQT
ncbi:2TM domain-containing protein [Actinophytocola oryzae]|uniref:2TM domain-containing protein n=1 Tax=Actinophytocola oryzae TaxID=502181 RepID=A0A4R7V463_9PSEU|nr:2TM domain-containing protein [Actinophytocola oryzae]TDV44139.1 2TM domain-containing protein [Actinophytocola oryzae]